MERIYFGCLAVGVLSPDWLSRKVEVCDFFRRLGEAAAPGGGECGPCPDFASYTLAFALKLRKYHGKTSIRVKMTRFENVGIFILERVWLENSLSQ